MTKPQNEWTELVGNFKKNDVIELANLDHIEKLSVTKTPRLKPKLASAFTQLNSVDYFWLWCDTSRAAMKYILKIPNLTQLHILALVGCSRLPSFAKAKSLKVFNCPFGLSENDLLKILDCKTLRQLSIQNSELTTAVIHALLLKTPEIESLDLECTAFNDDMAKLISTSKSITRLEIGNTKITRIGLSYIAQMTQLKELDLWATKINESDLQLLPQLPNLEYLSIGNYCEDYYDLNAAIIIEHLSNISSLQRIWLDGIKLTPEQKALLESRYQKVHITE